MLQNCIQSLILDINEISNYYERSKKGETFNFVLHVQPFTERVDSHLNEFTRFEEKILSLPLMNEKKLSLLILYIKELSVECFFEKTSKKIFLDKYKAVNHDLHYINRKVNHEIEG